MKSNEKKPIITDNTSQPQAEACSAVRKSVGDRLKAFISNRQTWGFLVAVAVMALISLVYFYPDNFEGNDLRQHDMVQGMSNGHEVQQYHEETGQTARWTNSLFSGMPTFQISPSYPSDSLFKWITTVYGLGLPSPSNLLFMMMLGFMILMVAMKIRWEYGLIGAIAWGFSTYCIIIIGAGHIWKFVALAYVPPTIAGVLLAYRGRRLAGLAMTALFMMMQLSANHIQMTYYFGFVIAGLAIAFLIESIRRRALRRWCEGTAIVAAGIILGAAANMPNLYHTYRYAKETQRGVTELTQGSADGTEATSGLSRDYITKYSYGVAETFTLLIPNVKGGATLRPVNGSTELVSMSETSTAGDYRDAETSYYLQQLPQYFGEPEPTNGPVYVGAIIFALFVLGCIVVRGPIKWALLALTLLSVALAWGRNFMSLTDLFIDIVPMYSKFRTVESILVIAEFTIPLLAIMGLYQLFKADDRKIYVKPMLIAFGSTAFICLLGAIVPSVFGLEDELSHQVLSVNKPKLYTAIIDIRGSLVSSDSLRSLLFVVLGGGILWLYLSKRLSHAIGVAGIGVLVLADLYPVNKRYIDTTSFYHPTPMERMQASASDKVTPTAIDLALMEDTDMHYRVADYDRFGSAEPSYFHKMIGGYHAAKLGRYDDLINRHIGRIASEQDFKILDMLNARYIVVDGQIMQNPEALGNAWFVDEVTYVDTPDEEMDALDFIEPATEAVADRKFTSTLGDLSTIGGDANATITLTEYAPDRLSYTSQSTSDQVAVFSEVYFPWGWQATIDGQPAEIGRVNYVLRAIRVPAGTHEIIMQFTVPTIGTTSTIATIAIIIIYVLTLMAILRSGGCCPCQLIKRRKCQC